MFNPKAISKFAKKVIYLPEVLGFVIGGIYTLFSEVIWPFAQIILKRAAVISQAIFSSAIQTLGIYTIFSYMMFGPSAVVATQGLITTYLLLGPSNLPFVVRHSVAALFAGVISNFQWTVTEHEQAVGRVGFLSGLIRFYYPLVSISNDLFNKVITTLNIFPPMPAGGIKSLFNQDNADNSKPLINEDAANEYAEVYGRFLDQKATQLDKLINQVFEGANNGALRATTIKNFILSPFKGWFGGNDAQDNAAYVATYSQDVQQVSATTVPELGPKSPTFTPLNETKTHPGLEFVFTEEEEEQNSNKPPVKPTEGYARPSIFG